MLTASPLCQVSTAPPGEVSFALPVPPVEKENLGGQEAVPTPALRVTLQEHLLGSHGTWAAGRSVGLSYWESDNDETGLQQPAQGSWQTEFIPAVPK